jgi:hypothetical protein
MRRTFIILAALTVLASLTYANPLCTTNTVAYYQANYTDISNGCSVGDIIFFNFNYSSTAHGGPVAPTNALVQITPDPTNTTEPGLIFSAPDGAGGSLWSVNGTSTLANPLYVDSTISFTAAVFNLAPTISQTSLDFANQFSVSGQGLADIAETVIFDGGTSSTKMGVDSNNGPFTSVSSFEPVSYLRVTKDLLVTVPKPRTGSSTGSASIMEFSETFYEGAPEPVSMLLFGSGLGGLFFLRRRR